MTGNCKQPLVLVDGSSYLFRAFHALPPLVSSRGHPTGAVKGVISMIRNLMKSYPDSHLAIVFDAKGKTFRSDIYPDYKAHRPPMPDELRSQIEPIHAIVRAMGLPLLIVPGVEADDVIGTLASQAHDKGIDTIISTGDKDLAQLVSGHVTLINTMTNEVLDEQGVKNKFGVTPAQFIDYLALVGDKADNIPGVPGVGPKTAVKWLEQYGNIDGLVEHAEEIPGKIGERLRENFEQLHLSYDLATIRRDVALDVSVESLTPGERDGQELYRLFNDMEFKTWLAELESQGVEVDTGQSSQVSSVGSLDVETLKVPELIEYRVIQNEEDLDALIGDLERRERFAISLVRSEGHFLDAQLIGLAFCTEVGRASYIPLGHDSDSGQPQLAIEPVLARLKPLLEDRRKAKVGFDLKESCHVLANYGIDLAPFKSDVLLASYVLNSVAIRHQLPEMVKFYLDQDPLDLESMLGKGRGKLGFHQLPIDQATRYAAEQADMILRLGSLLEHELEITGHLAGLYRHYELPLIQVLQKMERRGISVDAQVLHRQSEELGVRLTELEQEACDLAGETFNLGSPKQLQQIFYDKLALPVLKKTATGQPSTAEPVLQELAEQYELPRVILEHRSLSKLKSTYTDKLPLQVRESTGRIHSTYQQAVAATGRLSSTEPNLQNIPIRTAEGRRVRKAFISAPGYRLLAADYSQVELRIMAHLSRDEGLLKAFENSLDVHKSTAAEVFDTPLEAVTPEQRRSAKAINFGLIYGMSAFGLANQLGISRTEAQQYVDRYFERYPGVRRYMEQTQALADETGYVETLFGRRLYLPDIRAGNAVLRRAAQRTAINAPMQGTAADIIKQAMIDIDHWLDVAGLDARMLLQVHDELIFEVAEQDVALLAEGVRFRMVTAAALDVPLVVEVGVGGNWDEAH